jgi:nucleoside-diphosphate-sugar epimerase
VDLLVLGGTAFLGRAIAAEAVARGHEVTCLARGSNPVAEGVTFVRADRDEPGGLAAVAGRRWDSAVDVSRQPGQVRRAVAQLVTGHWVFVSTANVYREAAALERGEDSPILDPLVADVMASMTDYGAAKVACEQAVRDSGAPGAIVRAGLIGGPGDVSGRSGYWPWRFANPVGARVIVPDDPDLPCALIDVRDLAAWIVTLAERRVDGTFNATGPTTPLAEVLRVAAVGSTAVALPVPPARLTELGVESWMGPRSLPLWIDDPQARGFATLDTTRARAAGLATRPLADTFADLIGYESAREVPRQAGLTDDEERRLQAELEQ